MAQGLQDPVLSAPDAPPVGNGIQNRVAAVTVDMSTLEGDVGAIETQLAAVAWDDIQGPAIAAGGVAAVVVEAFGDTSWQAVFYRHDRDDVQYFTFQMPHRWDRGEVKMHAHIVPMSDPVSAQVIKLSGRFAWLKYGEATPLWASWTTFDVSHTVNPGDLRKPTIVPLFSSTPTGGKESDFLVMQFMRPGSSDAADTYTTSKPGTGTAAANMCLLMCDAHFTTSISKPGTSTEIPT